MSYTVDDFRVSNPWEESEAFLRCPHENCTWKSASQSWFEVSLDPEIIREARQHLIEDHHGTTL